MVNQSIFSSYLMFIVLPVHNASAFVLSLSSKRFRVHCNTLTVANFSYAVGQLSSRTRHRVLAVAALGKSLSMV